MVFYEIALTSRKPQVANSRTIHPSDQTSLRSSYLQSVKDTVYSPSMGKLCEHVIRFSQNYDYIFLTLFARQLSDNLTEF